MLCGAIDEVTREMSGSCALRKVMLVSMVSNGLHVVSRMPAARQVIMRSDAPVCDASAVC